MPTSIGATRRRSTLLNTDDAARGWLSPAKSWSIAGLLAGLIAASFWVYEGLLLNVIFTAAITLALAATVVLATRRAMFAAVAVTGFVLLVNGVAAAKLKMIGMVLHAYDLVFYLGSWSTIAYLWFAAPRHVLSLLAGVAILAMLGWLAWRMDGTRVRRWRAALTVVLALSIATITGLTKYDRRQTQFYWDAMYVSSFYSSWAETAETLWRGQLIEAAKAASLPPFPVAGACETAHKPPHIVLIHQESIVQPSLLPGVRYDHSVDPLFKSHDGAIHKLRVETYGGASWLTEFSILTGLSTHSFGGMRPFVQSLLAGKVRDTLTDTLARCGYRNVLFYPMQKNFVSNGRFYDAIGLKEVFDQTAQRAPSAMERDRFYYGNALDELERHVKTSQKPLFTYIQTMSGHWPYDYAFEPGVEVAGGAPGTDPEMHEYLRRVSMAKMDYDHLKAELARRFPGEPILIMHYGDHQPMATRKLLGFAEDTLVEEVAIGPDSIGYQTYYAVDAINYRAPALPAHDVVDVPYLPAILLQQAGLPLSEPNRERLRLMAACEGRYNDCKKRHEILSFHRRLLELKLIDAR